MWRSTLARRLHSSLSQNSGPPSSIYGMHEIPSCRAATLLASRVNSTAVGSGNEAASVGISGAGSVGSVGAISSVHEAIQHYGRCYWELSKAKLSLLVVATSGAGYILGSGNAINLTGLCCTCAGTMMVAASANSLNQVFEKENDSRMKRTMRRPLPSGRISVPHAAMWASTAGVAGTSLLAYQTNSLAAGLGAFNLFLYAFVYTPLKQIHPINTWVGAVVGAIPPLLGWAAACSELSIQSMILPAALYFWQIPHFMALAYLCRDDYLAGGFRMFSFNDPSGIRTALVSFRNCIYLIPLGWLAYQWDLASEWFALESTLLTLGISMAAFSFVRKRNTKNARRMFHASLLYLPVFMSGLILHRMPNENKEGILVENYAKEGIYEEELSEVNNEKDKRKYSVRRAPVAYASVAPFPFLPVPIYSPDS